MRGTQYIVMQLNLIAAVLMFIAIFIPVNEGVDSMSPPVKIFFFVANLIAYYVNTYLMFKQKRDSDV